MLHGFNKLEKLTPRIIHQVYSTHLTMDLYQPFNFGDICLQYVVMVILDLWTVREMVKVE